MNVTEAIFSDNTSGKRYRLSELPTISIITLCHNQEATVAQTIRSVQAQDYPFLEYIVVDDGSTDRSREVIERTATATTKVFHRPGFRPSPTTTLEDFLGSSSGEVLGWLNSDDILLPGAVETMAHAFHNLRGADWISGMATTLSARGFISRSRKMYRNKFDFLAGELSGIPQESTFFRRELWLRCGGSLSEEFLGFDWELWSRFFQVSEPIFLRTVVGAYRRGPQSTSLRRSDEVSMRSDQISHEMRLRSQRRERLVGFFWRFLRRERLRAFFALFPQKFLVWAFPSLTYCVAEYDDDSGRWQRFRVSGLSLASLRCDLRL